MSDRRRLVLASASPARRRLLEDAGLRPQVRVSAVDEHAVTARTTAELVQLLADAKAVTVAGNETDALVLGCDSLFTLDGVAMGKPACPAEARARWHAMRGRSGELLTGHCLLNVRAGRVAAAARGVVITTVRFGWPTDAEVEAYVRSGEPLLVAGAFTLLGRAGPFVEGVEGDPGSVIGLSLPLLRRLLAEVGTPLTALW